MKVKVWEEEDMKHTAYYYSKEVIVFIHFWVILEVMTCLGISSVKELCLRAVIFAMSKDKSMGFLIVNKIVQF